MDNRRREDIQGLRAVGALLVATFHIWIGRVSGGVDVFFVISGYLLVGSLVRELESRGSVDVLRFLARLVKRLLPASLFVIAVVLASAPFWLPQTRWSTTMIQVAASALYLENWYVARSAVDYLARDEVPSPLQHYWAMSVQVQALVLLCILLALFGFVAKGGRAGTTIFLAAIFAASISYSIYATARNQPIAYFDTFARVWEFALGGLVASVDLRARLAKPVMLIGGWLGLLLVVSCGALLSVSNVFPGYAALWPTCGAALILICGDAHQRLNVGQVLASRPLTWLGGISYALYLWHWPLLIFTMTVLYQTQVNVLTGSAILAASVLFAWVTTRFVEGSFRQLDERRPFRLIAVGAGAVAILGVADLGWVVHTRWAQPKDRLIVADPVNYPGAAVLSGRVALAKQPLRPGPLWVKKDFSPVYGDGCHQQFRQSAVLSCTYGNVNARRVLAVVGGSHSAHWVSALLGVLEGTDWKLVTYTKSSCLFSSRNAAGTEGDEQTCAKWNRNVLEKLVETQPDLVFTTATHGRDRANDHVPPQFVDQWRVLTDAGIPVAAIRDNPWFDADIPECVQVNGRDSPRCGAARTALLSDANPFSRAAVPPDVSFLDLSDRFCDGQFCPAVIGNVLVYSDKHHITDTYMQTLVPYLAQQLRPVLQAALD